MFFIAYVFKGQVLVIAGRVKIVSHSPFRTFAIFEYFCPLSYKNMLYNIDILANIPGQQVISRDHRAS